jgi:hypothetical protein
MNQISSKEVLNQFSLAREVAVEVDTEEEDMEVEAMVVDTEDVAVVMAMESAVSIMKNQKKSVKTT